MGRPTCPECGREMVPEEVYYIHPSQWDVVVRLEIIELDDDITYNLVTHDQTSVRIPPALGRAIEGILLDRACNEPDAEQPFVHPYKDERIAVYRVQWQFLP